MDYASFEQDQLNVKDMSVFAALAPEVLDLAARKHITCTVLELNACYKMSMGGIEHRVDPRRNEVSDVG